MRLFRPPFFGDAEPTTPDEIAAVKIAQQLGYATVGLRVDPGRLDGAAGRPDRQADHGSHGRYQSRDARADRAAARCRRRSRAHRGRAAAHHRRAARQRVWRSCRFRSWPAGRAIRSCRRCRRRIGSAIVDWYVFITASWLQATMHWLFMLAIGLGLARLVALCGLTIWGRYKARAAARARGRRRRGRVGAHPGLQRGQGHRRLGCAHPRQPPRQARGHRHRRRLDRRHQRGRARHLRGRSAGDAADPRRTAARRAPSMPAWRLRTARSSSRSTPIPSSSPTPSRVWRAGSATRRSARSPATPRSATAST